MIPAADSLLRSDSLRRAAEQLFVANAHFGPTEAADTLQTLAPAATAADLFGPDSILMPDALPASALPTLASHPLFQLLVLVLALLYTLLTYYHAGDIRTLFSRKSGSGGMSDIRSSGSYSHFLNLTGLLGLLQFGILSVKCLDLFGSPGIFPPNASAAISLATTATLLIMIGVQAGMLLAIGAVTLTQEFISELHFIRRSMLSLAAIITAPILFCFALSPAHADLIWTYIIVAEVVIITGLFLSRTLRLFIAKKISLLHWFLYLCTVEIFPASLIWLLITRQ